MKNSNDATRPAPRVHAGPDAAAPNALSNEEQAQRRPFAAPTVTREASLVSATASKYNLNSV